LNARRAELNQTPPAFNPEGAELSAGDAAMNDRGICE